MPLNIKSPVGLWTRIGWPHVTGTQLVNLKGHCDPECAATWFSRLLFHAYQSTQQMCGGWVFAGMQTYTFISLLWKQLTGNSTGTQDLGHIHTHAYPMQNTILAKLILRAASDAKTEEEGKRKPSTRCKTATRFCSECSYNMWSNVFVHGCLTHGAAVNNNYFWQAPSECYLLSATSRNHIFIFCRTDKRFFFGFFSFGFQYFLLSLSLVRSQVIKQWVF